MLCVNLSVKYFFLSRHFLFGGVIFDLDKHIFSWQTWFLGGCLRLAV